MRLSLAFLSLLAAGIIAENTITHSVGITDTAGRLTLRFETGDIPPPAGTVIEVDLPVASGGSAWSSGGLPVSCSVGSEASPFAAIAEGVLAVQVPDAANTDGTGHMTIVCETVRTTDRPVSLPAAVRFDDSTFATPVVTIRAPYRMSGVSARVGNTARNKTNTRPTGGPFTVTVADTGVHLSGDDAYFEVSLEGEAAFVGDSLGRCEVRLADAAPRAVAAETSGTRALVVDMGAGVVVPAGTKFVLDCGNATRPDYISNVTVRARTATLGDIIAEGTAPLCSNRGCNSAARASAGAAAATAVGASVLAALLALVAVVA